MFFALLSFAYIGTKPSEPVKLFGFTIFIKRTSPTDVPKTNLISNEMNGVSDIDFIVVYRKENAGPKEGWKWIQSDLNAGTKKRGDPFIYLTWKKLETSNNQNLITSIMISKSKKRSCEA